MAIRVAINGFGRIGRLTFRNLMASPEDFEVVAINDLTDNRTLATLLKYDSIHGRYDKTVEYDDDSLTVDGKKIRALAERDPRTLPWGDLGVDVCVESTGIFTARSTGEKPGYDSHLEAGAKRVVLSAPAKDGADLTCVMGVNDDKLTPDLKCVSNASAAPPTAWHPVAKVLHEKFGIEIRSDDHGSRLHQRPKRTGSASQRPVSCTGVQLKTSSQPRQVRRRLLVWSFLNCNGKLTGIAMRVPVPTGQCRRPDRQLGQGKPRRLKQINAADERSCRRPTEGQSLAYTDRSFGQQ